MIVGVPSKNFTCSLLKPGITLSRFPCSSRTPCSMAVLYGFGNQSDSHETGMGQLYCQVQDVQHRIIWPNDYSQSKLQGCDWW